MYKRNFRARRRFKRRGVRAAAYKALKKVNRLAKRTKPELKYEDAFIGAAQTITWSSYGSAVIANGQGTALNQHIGQKLSIKFIDVNYTLLQPNASTVSDTKVVVYVDKEANNPTIFTSTGTLYAPLAPLYRTTKAEYRVLLERNHAQTILDSTGYIHVRKRIYMKDLPVSFSANTSTVITNQLRIAAISNTNGNDPQLMWHIRVVYSDL